MIKSQSLKHMKPLGLVKDWWNDFRIKILLVPF